MGPLEASWATLKPAWAVLGSLEASRMHLGAILAVLVASWRHLGVQFGRLGPGKALTRRFLGLTRRFWGIDKWILASFRVEPLEALLGSIGPSWDRLVGHVLVEALMWPNVVARGPEGLPSYRTMCSPNRFGKRSGNTVGEEEKEEREEGGKGGWRRLGLL